MEGGVPLFQPTDRELEKDGAGEKDSFNGGVLPTTPPSTTDKSLLKTCNSLSAPPSTAKWRNSRDGTMVALAFVTGVGQLLRFTEILIKHGGVIFLIQYTAVYVFVGFPLVYAEMAIGQYTSKGAHGVFSSMAPLFTGIAFSMNFALMIKFSSLASILSSMISIVMRSFTNSFSNGCLEGVHSPRCYDFQILSDCTTRHSANSTPSSECLQLMRASAFSTKYHLRGTPVLDHALEYFSLLPLDNSHYRWPVWEVILSLAIVWVAAAAILHFGIRPLVYIAYVCTAAIIGLLFFLVYGLATLDEAKSLTFFVAMDWESLKTIEGWTDTVFLVFYTLNLGTGGFTAIASHNEFSHNFVKDVIIVCCYSFFLNIITAFLTLPYAGFVASKLYDTDVVQAMQLWIDHGNYAVMAVVAEVVDKEKGGTALTLLYFVCIVLLSFESCVISISIVHSSLLSRLSSLRPSLRPVITFSLAAFGFFSTFFFIGPGGLYQLSLIENFSTLAILFISLMQIVIIMNFYGFRRLITNVRTMVGGSGPVSIFWWLSWIFVAPFVVLATFFCGCFAKASNHFLVAFFMYNPSLKAFGFGVTGCIILWIPAVALYKIVQCKRAKEPLSVLLRATAEWGPSEATHRENARFNERAMRVR